MVDNEVQIGAWLGDPVDPEVEEDLLILVVPLAEDCAEQARTEGKIGSASHLLDLEGASRKRDPIALVIRGQAQVLAGSPNDPCL